MIQKIFDRIQYLIMIKIFNKLGTNEIYPNIIKTVYDKPINFTFNGVELKDFFLRSKTKQKCSFYSVIFDIVLVVIFT